MRDISVGANISRAAQFDGNRSDSTWPRIGILLAIGAVCFLSEVAYAQSIGIASEAKTSAALSKEQVDNVITWSLGPSLRGGGVAHGKVEVRLMPLGEEAHSRTIIREMSATSILPLSDLEGQVLLTSAGKLYLLNPGTAQVQELSFGRDDVALEILLVIKNQNEPSPGSTPLPKGSLEILVVGTEAADSIPVLFVLQLDGSRASLRKALGEDGLVNKTQFFRKYKAPRCQKEREHGDCLLVSSRHRLDRQPFRDKPSIGVSEFPNWELRDAAWVPGKGGTVYVLLKALP